MSAESALSTFDYWCAMTYFALQSWFDWIEYCCTEHSPPTPTERMNFPLETVCEAHFPFMHTNLNIFYDSIFQIKWLFVFCENKFQMTENGKISKIVMIRLEYNAMADKLKFQQMCRENSTSLFDYMENIIVL